MSWEHGEIAETGIWVEPYTQEEFEATEDVRDFVHTLSCDFLECRYSWIAEVLKMTNGEPYQNLYYHASEELWLCPTHWAEVENETKTTTPA